MKKNNKVFLIMLISTLLLPIKVLADSGLDSNYQESQSLVGSLISAFSSIFTLIGELLTCEPGSEDYLACHIILSIICLIVFYIITSINVFKIDNTINRTTKRTLVLLSISLIPTIIFGLFNFLTSLQLAIYLVLLIFYIIVLVIPVKIFTVIRLKTHKKNIKELDKNFNEEEFNKKVFDTYKDIQISWMNFELNKVKNKLSIDMYDKYQQQLDELKTNKQKNIMDNIEYKSNKIKRINIKDNNIIIECLLKITCVDYIVDNEDKVVKGKKDKKWDYTYTLVFSKNIKDKEYVLINKKMKEQK